MRVPVITGTIDRRMLVNFRIDPDVLTRHLPAPFEPKLIRGWAVGGICLIRLKHIRPRWVPVRWGIRSENAAHRFAVTWPGDDAQHEGVYIPRRDTSSRFNACAGGALFPGTHHHARFRVNEYGNRFALDMISDDDETAVKVEGSLTGVLPDSSVFESLDEASAFFEAGSLGYSPTHRTGHYDGLELRCPGWYVEPLAIDHVYSSFFSDPAAFPPDAIEFDCALLMRGLAHEWHDHGQLCCDATAA